MQLLYCVGGGGRVHEGTHTRPSSILGWLFWTHIEFTRQKSVSIQSSSRVRCNNTILVWQNLHMCYPPRGRNEWLSSVFMEMLEDFIPGWNSHQYKIWSELVPVWLNPVKIFFFPYKQYRAMTLNQGELTPVQNLPENTQTAPNLCCHIIIICKGNLTGHHTSIPAASATNGLADSGAQDTSSTTCSWSRRSHLHSFVATTHTRIVYKAEYSRK